METYRNIFITILLLVVTLVPFGCSVGIVRAQGNDPSFIGPPAPKQQDVLEGVSYTPLVKLPIGEKGETPSTWTISTYLAGMLRLIIALGGAVAVLTAIIGGVQYVASGIAPAAKKDAKDRITNAFIGLAIILTSYLLLNTISPDLVNFKLELPKVEGVHQTIAPTSATPCVPVTTYAGDVLKETCEPSSADTTACGPGLKPLTGEASQMEHGLKIIWTSSDSNVQRNLTKLKAEVGEFEVFIKNKGGTVTVNSAYRPLAYQAHLYEVFERWNKIKDNENPKCASLKEEISREFQKHELGGSVSSPTACKPHVKGTGVDLTVSGITYYPNTAELKSKGIDLEWQNADGDPWHYNLTNPPFSGCAE